MESVADWKNPLKLPEGMIGTQLAVLADYLADHGKLELLPQELIDGVALVSEVKELRRELAARHIDGDTALFAPGEDGDQHFCAHGTQMLLREGRTAVVLACATPNCDRGVRHPVYNVPVRPKDSWASFSAVAAPSPVIDLWYFERQEIRIGEQRLWAWRRIFP